MKAVALSDLLPLDQLYESYQQQQLRHPHPLKLQVQPQPPPANVAMKKNRAASVKRTVIAIGTKAPARVEENVAIAKVDLARPSVKVIAPKAGADDLLLLLPDAKPALSQVIDADHLLLA